MVEEAVVSKGDMVVEENSLDKSDLDGFSPRAVVVEEVLPRRELCELVNLLSLQLVVLVPLVFDMQLVVLMDLLVRL